MKWDDWRGSFDGRPTMLIKRLLGSSHGYRIDLHKFVRADDPECFHSHPAKALRLILWGGYVEEIMSKEEQRIGSDSSLSVLLREFVSRRPGGLSFIRPEFVHRLSCLLKGPSYSLWVRGPIRAKIELHGTGWPPKEERNNA